MAGLSKNPENKRYNFLVETINPNTGERRVNRFYGHNSQQNFAESVRKVGDRIVKVTTKRRRL